MKILDCRHYKEMLLSAANNLDNRHEEIDRLNVFPVPDGDTGTNMKMTFCDAAKDTANYTNENIGDCAKFLSKRMLMGARGNSGVILSQIFKGMAKTFEGQTKITCADMAKAFENSYKSAYRAVMSPMEGTILTVIREAADYGVYYYENHRNCSFAEFFSYLNEETKKSLDRTPDLLPVLKDAGVVDSGGAGLQAIIEGCDAYFAGKPIKSNQAKVPQKENDAYCLESRIALNERNKKEYDSDALKSILSNFCSEIKMRRINNDLMIHLHTQKPGEALTILTRYGTLVQNKLEPLGEEHHEIFEYIDVKTEHRPYALISVCNGKGIEEYFKSLNVDYIVSGGQTMNPSTEDFLNLINEVNADHILLFPNNANIILAAKQAQAMASDKNVVVVETRSIQEGVCACLAMDVEKDLQHNLQAMNKAIKKTVSLALTTSIKDTTFSGVSVKEGEYIGIEGKKILSHGTDLAQTAKELFDAFETDEYDFATIYYGQNCSEEIAQQLLDYLNKQYDYEGQLIYGQQDLYPLLIGVE